MARMTLSGAKWRLILKGMRGSQTIPDASRNHRCRQTEVGGGGYQ